MLYSTILTPKCCFYVSCRVSARRSDSLAVRTQGTGVRPTYNKHLSQIEICDNNTTIDENVGSPIAFVEIILQNEAM